LTGPTVNSTVAGWCCATKLVPAAVNPPKKPKSHYRRDQTARYRRKRGRQVVDRDALSASHDIAEKRHPTIIT
jgi:hypothetical protein